MNAPLAPPLGRVFSAATALLAGVLQGRTPEAGLARLDSHLRPAVFDALYLALRAYGRGDCLLARLLERPLQQHEPRALLLLALARLERQPDHAHTVVDQAVHAAGGLAGGRYKGLVNAVLRNFLRQREPLLAALADEALARWQHPAWWLEKLQASYPQDWPAIVAAGNGHPPLCLRINRRRTASADFCAALTAAGITARPLNATALLLDKPVAVEDLPGFAAGHCSVQDWGAQHAAPLLDLAAGQRVLDACAAPGGKTAHILESAAVTLTALELQPERARRIDSNLQRLGLEACLKVGDAARPADWWDGIPLDRILADVPCSASGVVRRHPDIKWLRRATDVAGFAQSQRQILDALWPLLVPGGKMLYSTCSVFPEENGEQVDAFLSRHPDARCRKMEGKRDLQLLPTPEHDGFYYCLLEKEA